MQVWGAGPRFKNTDVRSGGTAMGTQVALHLTRAVFFAALFGLENVVRELLIGDPPNSEERCHWALNRALQAACYEGHTEIVHILLEAMVDTGMDAQNPAMEAVMDAGNGSGVRMDSAVLGEGKRVRWDQAFT